MRNLLTIAGLFICFASFAQLDTSKLTPNNNASIQYGAVRAIKGFGIPVFGKWSSDTSSKTPGLVSLIGNIVYFCGSDGHYKPIPTDNAQLSNGSGYITNSDLVPISGSITAKLDTIKKPVITTVASLRSSLWNIQADRLFVTTDNGGGTWVYDSTDHTTPDDGIRVIVANGLRLKKVGSGWYNIKDFGGVGDGITDNRQAILNAINLIGTATVNANKSAVLYFPAGNYYCSDSISVKYPVHFVGESGWFTGYTTLTFASGKYGLVFERYNTPALSPARSIIYAADGSEIEGLCITQKSPLVAGHGIWAHCRVSIHDCCVSNFGGDGIHIDANGGISSSLFRTIQRIDMNALGTGYTSTPSVTVSGDGTGATAHAVLGAGVVSYTLTNPGIYVSVPTISILDATFNILNVGYGARATAVMGIVNPVVTNGGSGYTNATVTFVGGGGTGATGIITDSTNIYDSTNVDTTAVAPTGSVQITGGVITGITITNAGKNYTTPPTVVITGDGVGATATVNLGVVSIFRKSTGLEYETAPLLYFAGGTNAVATGGAAATTTLGTFYVKKIVMDNVGSNYTNATVSITGGGGTGALATAWLGAYNMGNANNWKVVNCRVTGCAHGMYVGGADANAGYAHGVDASSNRLNGINENSFLGNSYDGCHTNGNGLHPYFSIQGVAANTFNGCYSEGNQLPSAGSTSTIFVGGLHGALIETRGGALVLGRGLLKSSVAGGTNAMGITFLGNPDIGEIENITTSNIPSGVAVRRKIDKLTGDLSIDVANTANQRYHLMTGANTQQQFGSGANVPYATYIDRLYIGGTSTAARRVTSASAMPTSGTWTQGTFIINTAPTIASGVAGWSRTTTGSNNVLGTDWLAIQSPSASAYINNSTTVSGGNINIVGTAKVANLFSLIYSGTVANTPYESVTRLATGYMNHFSMYQSNAASGAYFSTPGTNTFSLSTGGYKSLDGFIATYNTLETSMSSFVQQRGTFYLFSGTGLTTGTQVSLDTISIWNQTGLSLNRHNPTAGLNLPASTTARASFNVPTGVAPTTPVAGDHYSDGTHEYAWIGGTWTQLDNSTSSATVSSVGLTMPGVLFNSSVSGSPITTTGTFTPTLAAQSAYTVLGNHTSGSATPTFGKLQIQSINATGTPSSTTFLAGNGAWVTPSFLLIDSPEHNFTSGIGYTATAAPTAGTIYYRWHQAGKMVTANFLWKSTGTAGTGMTAMFFPLPADMPAPDAPTANNGVGNLYWPGEGWMGASANTIPTTSAVQKFYMNNSAGTIYLTFTFSTGSWVSGTGTISYWSQ